MSFIFSQQAFAQPRYFPAINNSNPITKGLVDVLVPYTIGMDASSLGSWRNVPFANKYSDGTAPTFTAQDQTVFDDVSTVALTAASTQWGHCVGTNHTTTQYSFRSGSNNFNSIKECAMMCLCMVGSGAALVPFSYGRSTGGDIEFAFLELGGSSKLRVRDTANATQDVGSISPTGYTMRPLVYIGTRSQSLGLARMWVENRILATASPSALGTAIFDRTGVGTLYRSGAVLNFNGRIFLCASWNRFLLDHECASLSVNPWQIFLNQRPMLALDAIAAAAAALPQSLIVKQAINRAANF